MFSTLFSSSHNAEQRARYGAHYTSKADILLIVEPVLMQPLRRQWAAAQEAIAADPACTDAQIRAMLERLRTTTVLDPACGVGGFLYVAFHEMKNLEREVAAFAIGLGWRP
jgi:type I restriction-modification system DNA methylase subunit